jgi:hypothetical protein
MLTSPQAHPSGFVVGILSLTSGQAKQLTEATWYDTAGASTPPRSCRGIWLKSRSGTVRIGGVAAKTAGEGFTLTTSTPPLEEPHAGTLAGIYAVEAAASTATIEILCRTGGPS